MGIGIEFLIVAVIGCEIIFDSTDAADNNAVAETTEDVDLGPLQELFAKKDLNKLDVRDQLHSPVASLPLI